jgi:hypothetical protein
MEQNPGLRGDRAINGEAKYLDLKPQITVAARPKV